MKYRVIKAMLVAGAVLGFAGGFASLGARWHYHHGKRRAHFEDRVAEVCVKAAERGGVGAFSDRRRMGWEEPAPQAALRHMPPQYAPPQYYSAPPQYLPAPQPPAAAAPPHATQP